MKGWSILYRGSLSSCNYGCTYCPFAKTANTAAELRSDARDVERFTDWVEEREEEIGILFTPWGEALPHAAYQRAIVRLSRMKNVRKVAIQTNLSCKLDWLAQGNAKKIALWATYHPTQIGRDRFLSRCRTLDDLQIAHSVGVVGLKDQIPEIKTLRGTLNPSTYLWINAYKRDPTYYSSEEVEALEEIDPLFRLNTRYYPSFGRPCRAGLSTFSVDGNGNARRCHFIKEQIGNIYDRAFEDSLTAQPCTNATCGCHIGYVHLEMLDLHSIFGDGLLERIPKPDYRQPGAFQLYSETKVEIFARR
jgi:hypothetical protein